MSVRRPWPEMRYPTPTEWLDWLLALDRRSQELIAERCLILQQQRARCIQADHESFVWQARRAEADRRAVARATSDRRSRSTDELLWRVTLERVREYARLDLDELLDKAWARYGWDRVHA